MTRKLKLILVSFVTTVLVVSVHAQNLSTTIKVQAMDMATAWMKNDFNTFITYMHPEIITAAGGKEKMKSNSDSAYTMMKRFSVRVKRYWIGDPGKIVKYKNQLQAVLPQSTTLEMALGEMTAENSMIVISNDGGKNWWFIDTNLYKAEKLKDISIDISPELVIPLRKKPIIAAKKSNR